VLNALHTIYNPLPFFNENFDITTLAEAESATVVLAKGTIKATRTLRAGGLLTMLGAGVRDGHLRQACFRHAISIGISAFCVPGVMKSPEMITSPVPTICQNPEELPKTGMAKMFMKMMPR